ncbi:MAG: NUDIX domain-containing protein [Sphingomonadales bacterium]|nr:NUDIX domain-containing protein [Sphingomonadales bacterium]
MKKFTIRVYGILQDAELGILVSDEWIKKDRFTKFPGGGLQLGEGTRDCLIREFAEEMNLRIAVDEHIYTTDYFQLSAFNPSHQIISIYYAVRPLEKMTVNLKTTPFDFDERELALYEKNQQTESFRFIKWAEFGPEALSLPIDKIVAAQLKQR